MSDRSKPEPSRERATSSGAARPNRETVAAPVHSQTLAVGARSTTTLTVPGRLGRYKLLALLGQGGMGCVYKAHDTRLDRVVALKVPHLAAAAQRERFLKEAKAAALLAHPNICPVYDIGEADGVCFMTMAYVEGRPLSRLIRQGQQLPERTAALIVRQLALTMQTAHARGVVHRDLKPQNILINERKQPIIMDFGLALLHSAGDVRQTQEGAMLGTPGYMSPEQVEGKIEAQGPLCDVYAMGVILYELLTGRTPFEGPVFVVLAQILRDAPPSPIQFRPGLSAALAAICLKAMAKSPADRYPSMAAFAEALSNVLAGKAKLPVAKVVEAAPASKAVSRQSSASARPESREAGYDKVFAEIADQYDEQSPPRGKRGPLLAVAGGLVLLAGLAIAIVSALNSEDDDSGTRVVANGDRPPPKENKPEAPPVEDKKPETLPTTEKKPDTPPTQDKKPKPDDKIPIGPPIEPGKPRDVPAMDKKPVDPPPMEPKNPGGIDEVLRKNRNQRWNMDFKTTTGEDYRRHLEALGATLAFPVEGDKSRYLVIRNLKDPRSAKFEVISEQNRLFWVDANESTVQALCTALGTPPAKHFVAYFPEDLERRLLDLELAYMQAKHGKKNEELIQATRFQIVKAGGSYDVRVTDLTLKKVPEPPRRFEPLIASPLPAPVMAPSEARVLRGHIGIVNQVAVSASGHRVISAGADRTARVWDAETGIERWRLTGHPDIVWRVAIARDGKLAASGGQDNVNPTARKDFRVRLWNLDTGKLIATLGGPQGITSGLAFTPDGQRLIGSCWDGRIRIWETQLGRELRNIPLPASVVSVVCLPDGKSLLAGLNNGTAVQCDLNSGEILRTLVVPGGELHHVDVSKDGSRAAVVDIKANKIHLWNLKDGKKLFELPGHNGGTLQVAFGADGNTLMAAAKDRSLWIWDLAEQRTEHRLLKHTGEVHWVARSDNEEVIATCGADQTVRLWRHTTGHTGGIAGADVSRDGRWAITGGFDNRAVLWDNATRMPVRRFEAHTAWVWGVSLSPDNSRVLTASADKTIGLWDANSGKLLQQWRGHEDVVTSVTFSPDGLQAASASWDKTVRLWEVATGREIRRFTGHLGQVWHVRFSDDGKLLLSASADQTARLMDIEKRSVTVLNGHGDLTSFVAFSPDGRKALTSSHDRKVRVWDTAGFKLVRTFEGHTDRVQGLAVSRDGRLVLSGGYDKLGRLWDIETGDEFQRLEGHTGNVQAVAFLPDGKTAMTTSALDPRPFFWRLPDSDEIEKLRARKPAGP